MPARRLRAAPGRGRRRHLAVLAAAALLGTGAACGASPERTEAPPTTAARGATEATAASDPQARGPAAAADVPPPGGVGTPPTAPVAPGGEDEAADPVRVQVGRIGVDADLIPLGVDGAGALEVPSDFARAGWWRAGPEPGERGPAVIVGHVDSRSGPAVFHRLRELVAGDRVTVQRADGTAAEFVVDRVEQHPKAVFPTEAVYGDTAGAELRLVTCGGVFDRTSRHYLDNTIVFARPA